jgi:hypothetical protein
MATALHASIVQLRPKRHKGYESFTITMCTPCLQHHISEYLVRYPALKTAEEKCQCPCGHEVTQ